MFIFARVCSSVTDCVRFSVIFYLSKCLQDRFPVFTFFFVYFFPPFLHLFCKNWRFIKEKILLRKTWMQPNTCTSSTFFMFHNFFDLLFSIAPHCPICFLICWLLFSLSGFQNRHWTNMLGFHLTKCLLCNVWECEYSLTASSLHFCFLILWHLDKNSLIMHI